MDPSYVGLMAGTLCAISFLPQVIKIWQEKSTRDLSLPTFLVFSIGVSLWLVYGFMIGEWPIILANALMVVLAVSIFIMKLKYG